MLTPSAEGEMFDAGRTFAVSAICAGLDPAALVREATALEVDPYGAQLTVTAAYDCITRGVDVARMDRDAIDRPEFARGIASVCAESGGLCLGRFNASLPSTQGKS